MERGRINLAAREEIDRALLILHLDVLIVADKEASLSELEDVLMVADWTDQLARCHIPNIRLLRD